MSDVADKIIGANSYRHGRSVVWSNEGGLYTAGGRTGTVAPIAVNLLETNLTDRFAQQDGTDDAITSFNTRSQTVGTGTVPLTGVLEGTKIQIKAGDANSGTLYVGLSDVTANTNPDTDGFPLAAGQGTYIPIVQTGIIHFRSTQANEKVFILEI